jgi:hypothetical protein
MPKIELQHFKHNVHSVCGKEVVRVQADLDKKVYDYLFRHVIPYEHGARQAIINYMFQCLYEECQEQGIPAVWDETSGERLRNVINNLNFKPHG